MPTLVHPDWQSQADALAREVVQLRNEVAVLKARHRSLGSWAQRLAELRADIALSDRYCEAYGRHERARQGCMDDTPKGDKYVLALLEHVEAAQLEMAALMDEETL